MRRSIFSIFLTLVMLVSMTAVVSAESNYCKTGTGANWTYSTFKVKGDNTLLTKKVTLKQSKVKCVPASAVKDTGYYYQRYRVTIRNLTDGTNEYDSWGDSSHTIYLKKNKHYQITLYAKGLSPQGSLKDKWSSTPRWIADPTRATWE